MKKVLFTATVDSHILQFHLPFLKLFKEKGYEVHVATNGNEEIPYCDKKHVVCFERSPFKINNLKAIKQLKIICEKEQFDIIHTHTPMGSVVTRLAARKSRKKYHTRVIYTAHGFHFYKGAPLLNWLLFYPVEKYLAKYTDTLITINNEDYELAKKKFSKRCFDIQYVPGVGIDEEKFNIKMSDKEKLDLRKSLGLKKDDFVLTCVARLDKNKNQGFLIDVVEKLSIEHDNIHLLLVGPDEINGFYVEKTLEKKLVDKVHFLGMRKDIPKILSITDVVVSASYREGLPVNVMEAFAVGKAVVALNCRGMSELIDNGVNGFVVNIRDKYILDNYCECLLKIYNYNEYEIDLIEKNNLNKIKKHYIDIIIRSMEKIYFKKNMIAYLRSTAIYNDSRAIKEINSYKKNGFKVITLGWNRLNEKIDLDSNEYMFYEKNSKYGSGIKNIFKIISFNMWIKRTLKKHLCEFDIIHACDFDTSYIAYKICKKYNKKYIYDIYDYYVDCHNLGPLRFLIEKIDINIINNANNVIICTEKRREQIKKASPKKITVIHNSPNIINDTYNNKKISKMIRIGYFGILQDSRLLIEVTEKIKSRSDIEFIIGGFGKYSDYFEEISAKYDNISFLGTLPYSEVLKHEKNVDVLFATYDPQIINHRYSAPNKVYEAMALGKPIIVCRNTGIDDLVIHENIGKVINYSADEFLTTLKTIDHINSEKIIKTFANKYCWEIMEKKLINLISDIS